ncbi:MAG: ATP-grasp domain-containing protein [Pirellulales bacterium]|nr:ATP-grasp domain-containing protein [Pirellulales bacterium]
MSLPQNLLLIGASVRAAAASAVQAGYQPEHGRLLWCADRFGDTDLQMLAEITEICDPFPTGFPSLLANAPSGTLIYTGAMENHLQTLAACLTPRHRLAGNSPEVVAAVRDPFSWTAVLRQAGLPFAEIRNEPPEKTLPKPLQAESVLPQNHTPPLWLCKPLRSGGGIGINFWSAEPAAAAVPANHFWQKYIPGTPVSAVYVAAGRQAVCLGSTRQLIGQSWCWGETASPADMDVSGKAGPRGNYESATSRPRSFQYCGSMGPLHLPDDIFAQWQAIGDVLAREFGLVGLFGVDAIWTADGRIVPVEINPRYTASIEVLERSSLLGTRGTRGERLLAIKLHLEACLLGKLPARAIPFARLVVGKAILHVPDAAPRRTELTQEGFDGLPNQQPWRFTTAAAQWCAIRNLSSGRPSVADLPMAESPIYAGEPLLTIFAEGTDETAVEAELLDTAGELYELLQGEVEIN